MSHIDKLIADLCPNGIEFIKIEDLFDLKNGYTPSKSNSSFWENGTVPWFRMEDIRANGRVLSHSLQQISESGVKGGKLFPPNSLLVATSATIGEHALITVPHLSNQRFTSLSVKNKWTDQVDIKFLYHYAFILDKWCRANTTTSSFASVDMTGFKNFPIPIPPLEVQREIVRVLDKFTQLEAELEAELEARRRQYEYYRDHLLTFSEEATLPRLPLSEVALIVRGASPRPIRKFLTSDKSGVPWIKIGDVAAADKYITTTAERITEAGAAKSRRVSPGDFVLSNSMSFGRPFIMKIEGCVHDGWLVISNFDESFVPDFLYHLLRSQPIQEEFVRRAGSGGAVSNLNSDTVKALTVPIPPLREQRRIVSILDKFDSLVNDLSIGLPAELAARRKQYEYYRDRLLTFEEKR